MDEIEKLMLVRELFLECCQYELDGRELLNSYSDEEISAIYNGIGSENFPVFLREFLDALHPSLRCVAMIHDLEYHRGGDSREFHASNRRFAENGARVACAKYAWYDPRRYWISFKSRQFAELCEAFGRAAWCDGLAEKTKETCGLLLLSVFGAAVVFFSAGCSNMNSAVAGNNSVEALKLEATGSIGSGTLMPNLLIGGAISQVGVSPMQKAGKEESYVGQRLLMWTRRQGIFGEIWGSVDSSTQAITYIGSPGETAEESQIVLNSFAEALRTAGEGSGK